VNSAEANPFYALFDSPNKAEEFCQNNKAPPRISENCTEKEIADARSVIEENDVLERIFLVTLDCDFPSKETTECTQYAVILEECAAETPFLQLKNLDHILFERLVIPDFNRKVLVCKGQRVLSSRSDATDANPMSYLLACYNRAQNELSNTNDITAKRVEICKSAIVSRIALCLMDPDIIVNSDGNRFDVHTEFLLQLQEHCNSVSDVTCGSCFSDVFAFLSETYPDDVEKAFSPIYLALVDSIKSSEVTIGDGPLKNCLNVLTVFSSVKGACESLLRYRIQHLVPSLSHFTTLLDLILAKTCLITNPLANDHRFFNGVASLHQARADDEEAQLHCLLESYHDQVTQIFRNLLRFTASRSELLTWLGNLFSFHAAAGKMWMHENTNPLKSVFPTDALFLNVSAVLVRLAMPFCAVHSSDGVCKANEKFLKIDPSYCLATRLVDRLDRSVHLHSTAKETCIGSSPNESAGDLNDVELSTKYGFVTECFMFTHTALHLGVHGLLEKFYRLNRELGQLQDLYRDVMEQGANTNEAEMIKNLFERAMAVYLTTKAALTEPNFVENFCKFHATTACFLIQCAHTDDRSSVHEFNLDMSGPTPRSLKMLPEYIVENTTDFLLFLRRFSPSGFTNFNGAFDLLYTFAAIFMGNKSRLTNPHLRASFAETLEIILPIKEVDVDVGRREENFAKFRYVENLTHSVIKLFIDIEFTGDPHQFEQKFNYRRPLYKIMKFLWADDRGRKAIATAAISAVEYIECAEPPLLLRFVNLFLNDAIFLLDEAVDYLKQIKTLERERDGGEWNDLLPHERQQKERSLKELIMISRFHNMMSNETIDALAYLSEDEEVIKLLCHPVLIKRIAEMLNHFLLLLVGPSMGELKVRDFSICEFKPQQLVVGICAIYTHLAERAEFAEAVAGDGRSYKPDLFPRAIRVLRKVNDFELCDSIKNLSEKVRISQNRVETEDELFQDAPEEFFDPILETVMSDPVILPSSRVTVDRATIARHLLSDNTDPFNRMPLKLEDVIENADLARRIQEWKADKL